MAHACMGRAALECVHELGHECVFCRTCRRSVSARASHAHLGLDSLDKKKGGTWPPIFPSIHWLHSEHRVRVARDQFHRICGGDPWLSVLRSPAAYNLPMGTSALTWRDHPGFHRFLATQRTAVASPASRSRHACVLDYGYSWRMIRMPNLVRPDRLNIFLHGWLGKPGRSEDRVAVHLPLSS